MEQDILSIQPAELLVPIQEVRNRMDAAAKQIGAESLYVFSDSFQQLTQACRHAFRHHGDLPKSISRDQQRQAHLLLLRDMEEILGTFQSQQLPIIEQYLKVGIAQLIKALDQAISEAPEWVNVPLQAEQLAPNPQDDSKLRRMKTWKSWRHKQFGHPLSQQVRFRKLLQGDWQSIYLKNLHAFFNTLNLIGNQYFQQLSQVSLLAISSLFSAQSQEKNTNSLAWEDAFLALEADFQTHHTDLLQFIEEFHNLMGIRLNSEIHELDINQQVKRPIWPPGKYRATVRNFSRNWLNNQQLLAEELLVSLQLQELRAQVIWLNRGVLAELEFRCFTSTESVLNRIQEELNQVEKLIQKQDWEALQELQLDPSDLLILPDERISSGAMAHLLQTISNLPENIRLIPDASWNRLAAGEDDLLPAERYPLAEMVNYLTNSYYVAPLEQGVQELPEVFKSLYHKVQGAIRLLTFNLPSDKSGLDPVVLQDVMHRTRAQLNQAQRALLEQHQLLVALLREAESKVLENLAIRPLYEESQAWRLTLQDGLRKGRFLTIRHWIKEVYHNRFEWLNRWLLKAKDQILLADFRNSALQDRNFYAELHHFAELVSPSPTLLQALPFYYKQLFIGNQRIARRMLVGREPELAQAERAIKRMRQGAGGALMIIGEPQSGKTYFSEYVADIMFPGKMVLVSPPPGGSRKVSDLTAAFKARLVGTGNLNRLIRTALPGTVFLIDDLELWWERSQEGIQVILRLFKLIDQHGADYHFVINCNHFTFRLISHMISLEAHLSDTISLRPFTLQALENTLLDRHNSGALTFELEGNHESRLRPRQLNRFFRRIYASSRGNIGFGLRMWLGNINRLEHEVVKMTLPLTGTLPEIDDPDWLTLLTQFVLHKRLHMDRILRIYPVDTRAVLRERIFQLERAGLIQLHSPEVYELNPYLLPYILRLLTKNQLL